MINIKMQELFQQLDANLQENNGDKHLLCLFFSYPYLYLKFLMGISWQNVIQGEMTQGRLNNVVQY